MAVIPERGRGAYSLIVWLASYPRSGNTLLRTILHQAFGLPSYSVYDDPCDIGANPGVAQLVGHRPLGMDLDRFLDEHRRADAPTFLKTHDAPELAHPGERAIYIARDGRAASVSYRNYLRRVIGRPRVTIEDVVLGRNVRFGHWSGHIESWQPRTRPHTLLIRFEDLMDAPERSIAQVREFTGLRPIAEWQNRFEAMHRIDPRFFDVGSNTRNIALLDPGSGALFWERHGRYMAELGYQDERAPSGTAPPSAREPLASSG